MIVLSACVTPQEKPLEIPQEFLGVWQPASAASNVNVSIHENGKIEDMSSDGKSVIATYYYKVIHKENPRDIYLAIFSPADETHYNWVRYLDTFQFIRLVLEDRDYDPSARYIRYHHAYFFDAEQWESLTNQELWAYYQTLFNEAGGELISSGPYVQYDDMR